MHTNMANNDPSGRRILPQSSQMSSFSFAPSTYQQQPKETQQRNYVFVDEHNRHKRLKVMRACEGCRRRKIKCDAATTNTWPCSACVRLKLQCVRPTGFDGLPEGQGFDDQPQQQPQSQSQQQSPQPQQQQQPPPQAMYNTPLEYPQQLDPAGAPPQSLGKSSPAMYGQPAITYGATTSSAPVPGIYGQASYPDQAPLNLNNYTTVPPSMSVMDSSFTSQPDVFPTPPLQQEPHPHPHSPPDSAYITNDDQSLYAGGGDLADLLGTLRMNEAGSAPYLNNRMQATKTIDEETPAVGDDDDDYKSALPPLVSGPGLKIRIPPELMPDDDTVLHHFDLYFTHVHPYVPVLDRVTFYEQWQTKRASISPLLIEALLAISGRLADEPAQGQQWLALATKHADSFMDVPRLSTLQALLIMLKAREAAPKRGYYYRSWMWICQCVQMGKDLGLEEHYADHKAGLTCGSNPAECLMKTRIWQTIFVCELMIGSPQGRTDLAASEDSVDVREPQPTPGVDEADMQVSRNFVYLTRIVCNVARMNRIYARLKRNKDWGADPEFTRMNPLLHAWPNELPPDLSVTFPPDGSPPWLPSPFIGNMHSYYYLSILLLHRPQLQALNPSSPDGHWKQHMTTCYSSAKYICRLEEAILNTYDLNGLQNMQRGVNFTIYTVLTCILVHLIALTSPDPDFNLDAREYFTRHMRILERCMSAWPMADMQRQIDAMREAFSADVRKPFVLKPSFPYGSPSPSSSHSSPRNPQTGTSSGMTPKASKYRPDPRRTHPVTQLMQQQQQQQQMASALGATHGSAGYMGHPVSPAVSAGDMKTMDSPLAGTPLAGTPLGMMTAVTEGQVSQGLHSNVGPTSAPGWNPARIFEQWNTTFGAPQAAQASSLPGQMGAPSPTGSAELQGLPDVQAMATMNAIANSANTYPITAPPPPQPFVTPAMWQESVASVYEGGLKRTWDYSV